MIQPCLMTLYNVCAVGVHAYRLKKTSAKFIKVRKELETREKKMTRQRKNSIRLKGMSNQLTTNLRRSSQHSVESGTEFDLMMSTMLAVKRATNSITDGTTTHSDVVGEAFTLFDPDDDGNFAAEEIGAVMRSLGYDPAQSELQQILDKVDTDGNGRIDFLEFKAFIGQLESDDANIDTGIDARPPRSAPNTGWLSQFNFDCAIGTIFKIVCSYFQIVSLITTVYTSVSWTEGYQSFTSGMQVVSAQPFNIVMPKCVDPALKISGYDQFIMAFAVPVISSVLIVVYFLACKLYWYTCKGRTVAPRRSTLRGITEEETSANWNERWQKERTILLASSLSTGALIFFLLFPMITVNSEFLNDSPHH